MIKFITTCFFVLLLPFNSVFAFDINELQKFDKIAIKRIANSEPDGGTSHQQIYGSKSLVNFFGSKNKKKFEVNWKYISDDTEQKDFAGITWYYNEPSNVHKLYYKKNIIMKYAEGGDTLVIGRKGDEILMLIVDEDSDVQEELFETLGIETEKDKSIWNSLFTFSSSDDEEDEEEIEEVIEDELVKSDVEVLRDEKNKKLVIIGKVSKFQDGDSFVLGELFKVRMLAIDTPEKKQMCKDKKGVEFNCGKASSEHLKKLIGKGDISCEMNGWGSFNRHLFVCKNSKGLDINKQMVVDGYAVMSTYKPFLYEKEELDAKKNKKGLWSGTFQHPSDYRKDKRKK